MALVASGACFYSSSKTRYSPGGTGGYVADTSGAKLLQLNKITCTTKGLVCLLHCLSPLMRTLKSVTILSLLLKITAVQSVIPSGAGKYSRTFLFSSGRGEGGD